MPEGKPSAPPTPIHLEAFDGRRIHGTLHPGIEGKPLVLMSHGLLGHQGRGFLPYVATAFAEAGFPTLRFNFSGSGMGDRSDGPFIDPPAFEADTITRQVEDLHAILAGVRSGLVPGIEGGTKVFLWGHSRGGGVSLLAAVRDPTVAAVATWATISRVNRYPVAVTKDWREKGFREFTDGWTGQGLRASVAFLDDLAKWNALGDIPVEAYRLKVPVLLVHGAEDGSVKPTESESLAAILPTARLALIAGADHHFNCTHPFTGPTETLQKALEATKAFFRDTALRA